MIHIHKKRNSSLTICGKERFAGNSIRWYDLSKIKLGDERLSEICFDCLTRAFQMYKAHGSPRMYCPCGGSLKEVSELPDGMTHVCKRCGTAHAPYGVG